MSGDKVFIVFIFVTGLIDFMSERELISWSIKGGEHFTLSRLSQISIQLYLF